MSSTPPGNDPKRPLKESLLHGTRGWRSTTTLLRVAVAFAVGLLLFAALWWRDRGVDFYRAQGAPQADEGQQFEPLPAPLPADASSNASGMQVPGEGMADTGARVEQPAPNPIPSAPPPIPRPPAGPADVSSASPPTPLDSPAPPYPVEAFRNGESGTVLLRVHVDAAGVPVGVDLVQSSRSRSLDRAASDAVKRWRFRPAQRGGQAVPGDVQVPIAFRADR